MEPNPTEERSVNLDYLKHNVGGDAQLMGELIDIFLESGPTMLSAIKAALKTSDTKGLETAAHTLKGAASNFGGQLVVRIAKELEDRGNNHTLEGAQELVEALSQALDRMIVALGEEKGLLAVRSGSIGSGF